MPLPTSRAEGQLVPLWGQFLGTSAPGPTLAQKHLHPDQPLTGSKPFLSAPLTPTSLPRGLQGSILLSPTSQMWQLRLAEGWLEWQICFIQSLLLPHCPLPTRALFPALGVPSQPAAPATTSPQSILSGMLREFPLASSLAHFPKPLEELGRSPW